MADKNDMTENIDTVSEEAADSENTAAAEDGEDIGILAVGQPEMGLAFENEAVVAGVDEAESAEEFLGDDEEGSAIVGGRTVDKECVPRVENRYVVRSKNEWVAVVEAFNSAAVVDAHRVVGLDKIDTVGWHTSHIVENDDAFFFDFSLHLTYKIQAVFHSVYVCQFFRKSSQNNRFYNRKRKNCQTKDLYRQCGFGDL